MKKKFLGLSAAIFVLLIMVGGCSVEVDNTGLTEKLSSVEKENLELKDEIESLKVDASLSEEAANVVFVEKANLFMALPEHFSLKEDVGSYGDMFEFLLTSNDEMYKEFGFSVRVATLDSVQDYADQYEGNEYCIDHGMCDEEFDSGDYIKGFKNIKSVVLGDGSQEQLSGQFFGSMNNAFFDQNENELKTLGARTYAIFNNSFKPSGNVWRSYVTYVGDARVTFTVLWGLNSRMDAQENFHEYDKEADALVEKLHFGAGV